MRRRRRSGRCSRLVPLIPAVLVAFLVAGCGGGDGGTASVTGERPPIASGPVIERVYSLDLSPDGDELLIGTDRGIFRVPPAGGQARLLPGVVAASQGPIELGAASVVVAEDGQILTSGHPAKATPDLPESLGLIVSSDAVSWRIISLYGEADFHPLRERHNRLYGFDFQGLRIMVSGDGVNWDEHEPPGPVYDLVVDPDDETHLVASTDQGLVESRDDGERWRPLADSALARLAWASDGQLFIVEPNGTVMRSDDGGVSARTVGTLGGRPQAVNTTSGGSIYAARDGGSILRSEDDGRTWTEVARFRTRAE